MEADQNTLDIIDFLNTAIEKGQRFKLGKAPNEIIIFDGTRDDITMTNTHGGGTWFVNDYQ